MAKPNFSNPSNDTLKQLRGIGHRLNPIIMVGGNGLTPHSLKRPLVP